MSSRPSTSHGLNTSSVPLIKSFRFSSSHDVHNSTSPNGTATSSGKRTSRLQEYLSRSRTASLPPRPHTSNGANSSNKYVAPSSKGTEVAEDSSQDSAMSNSPPSTADPFAAHPAASASFVTYSTSGVTPIPHSPDTPRPHTSHAQPTILQAASPTSLSSSQSFTSPNATSHVILAHSASSGSNASGARRRGSILHAASDALSRMNPIRTRSVGKQPIAGIRVTSPPPIVLTEVIEISESAVRASKRQEEEDQERERLRDAAARALGIGDVEAEVASFHTHSYVEDDLEQERSDFDAHEFGVQEDERIEQEIPVAISPVTGLPIVANGNGTISSSHRAAHTRSRSGSHIPMGLTSLPRPMTPKAPSIMSQAASVSPPVSHHNTMSMKSHSTPPALTLTASHRSPPPLRTPSVSAASTAAGTSSTSSHSRPHALPHIHERTLPPPKIPPFPTTPSLLGPFAQRSGTIPRYYPAPTLLMFALSRQWKGRYFVLTTPLSTPTAASPPVSPTSMRPLSSSFQGANSPVALAPSYLHMFKSSGADERELERLEINEESVAYVADGEVGGRKCVVKFEGILRRRPSENVSPVGKDGQRKDGKGMQGEETPAAAGGEEGRTTWIVQILDPEETQKWIEGVKGVVLNQRSVRAGLGITSAGGGEPRGDLDVILSMRAQGFSSALISPLHVVESPTPLSPTAVRPPSASSPAQSNSTAGGSSPTSSLTRSQAAALTAALNTYTIPAGPSVSSAHAENNAMSETTSPSRPSITAGAAFKSLFAIGGGARPRSPSTASVSMNASLHSLSPEPQEEDTPVQPENDSFARAGTNLLSILRNGSFSNERSTSAATSVAPTPRVATPADHLLDRKILQDCELQLVENEGEPIMSRKNKGLGLSVGPPRDRDGNYIVPGRVSSDMGSQSLHPPPRKRAGTVSSIAVSTSADSSQMTYSHGNGSTAESLGVKNPNLLSPSPSLTASPASARPKDRRARASWSSVSSVTSNDPSSSPDDARARRWSRRSSHPYRLSPPYGPPPATPPSSPQARSVRTPPSRHPYAAGEPLSRTSSAGSQSPETHPRPFSSKRASAGSVQSFSTVSTTQSRATGIGAISIFSHGPRPRSSHRASMPPPPRPAPNGALPPTPGENYFVPSSPPIRPALTVPGSKSSFRESLMRVNPLGIPPPTQPPTSGLPPRPDEQPRRHSLSSTHQRSSSHGSSNGGTALYSIPASPSRIKSPFPPPDGPLPPTPSPASESSLATKSPRSSIKRRLRMLSSPPTSPPLSTLPVAPSDVPTFVLLPSPSILEPAVPPTSIGEPITTLQNDPDFLAMASAPSTPPPRTPMPETPVLETEGFVSLPPPPRRSSRQVSSQDKYVLNQEISSTPGVVVTSDDDPPTQFGDDANDRPVPPPELEEFRSPVRSPDHCAVSLVDVSI